MNEETIIKYANEIVDTIIKWDLIDRNHRNEIYDLIYNTLMDDGPKWLRRV